MKRILTLAAAILMTTIVWAQSPEKMSYQAVVRNANDVLLTSATIGMQISILEGSPNGAAVYVETQTPTTNANGLVSLEIGSGTTSDDFSTIDWENGSYFIKIETDPTGGTNYSITGTSQLMSVPYALHAKSAETITGSILETDPIFNSSEAANITTTHITTLGNTSGTNTGDQDLSSYLTSEVDGSVTNEIQTINKTGTTVTLSNGGGSFTDEVNDSDFDPLNELQTLGLVGNNLQLSNGGGNVDLSGLGGLWSQNGAEIYYNNSGVGIGTTNPEDDVALQVAGNLFVQTNLGTLSLGYPNNGNQWQIGTVDAGADLLFSSKPSGLASGPIRYRLVQTGEFTTGGVITPLGWMHLQQNSNPLKPHLLLEESEDDFARLGFKNTANTGFWQIAAAARDGSSGAANSAMHFSFENDEVAADRMTILGNGHVGIGNNVPDEMLVIGENLGAGWAIPATTIGSSAGGALQVGTPEIDFSIDAGTSFDRTRLIATDANGFGHGKIEMRTRQLNIGVAPGVDNSRTYPLRVVQNSDDSGGRFGMLLVNGDTPEENWEFYVGTTTANNGNLSLYHDFENRGSFDAVSGNYTPSSDARLKTNVTTLTTVLPAVLELKPKRYNYKADLSRIYNGFLAQELQAIFPEAVTEIEREEDEESTFMVDYAQLTVLAIRAIQEQQGLIESQNEKIETLEQRLEAIEILLQKN